MRGSLKQRSKGSWSLILDLGYEPDAAGILKRRQKWVTVHGTRKQAETQLNNLLSQANGGTFIEPSKLTLGVWLREWLDAIVKVQCRPATYVRYQGIIDNHITTAPLGQVLLQKLRPTQIEQYYAAATVSASTLTLHHAVLHGALQKAKKDGLITSNPALDLDGKPRVQRDRGDDVRQHCWTATDARTFLEAAKAAGPQPAALYTLALDSGARKGELCGLRWSDLDLDAAKMRVVQQLLTPGPEPVFGPTKTGHPRTISLGAETVTLLRAHRAHQREVLMANRTTYRDLGLVFAKEWSDVRRKRECLGHPLQKNNLGQREYATVLKASGVKPIKFHGMRHTMATLMLLDGVAVHVVSERLGHSKVSMTMEVYAHVLPDTQQDAAAALGVLLHGR